MPEPPQIKIAILDISSVTTIIKTVFENIPNVISVSLFTEPNDILNALKRNEINSLVIDIFTVEVANGIKLIDSVRREFSYAPICLIGDKKNLNELPGVPVEWKKRLDHYFLLPKDEAPDQLIKRAESIVKLFEVYLHNSITYERILGLRNEIAQRQGAFKQLSTDAAIQIEKVLVEGERALEIKKESRVLQPLLIQGFEGEDIKNLVKDTLEKASAALDGTARVNKWILVCGALLVIISFIVASVTQRWEAVTFGGFGIAGIIASLITNPLKSIGVGAKRLVILQVVYLNFLKQLSLLDNSNQDSHQISAIDKSKQLNEAMEKGLEYLDKHFG